MLSIRKYEEKDYDGVCFACLNSDEDDDVSESLAEFILHTFCEYYIEKEPENCFVLDDDGKAVGYIICAEDYDKFKSVFDAEYFPRVVHLGEDRIKWAKEAYLLHEKFKADYPAHLHIDILPQYQRGGNGGKLVQTLSDHLSAKGIRGVMLTTGTTNTRATNFYRKYGFEELEIYDTDIAFGKKLI
jgi:ribosomal protein S18 acetylase RimI-like enzyme